MKSELEDSLDQTAAQQEVRNKREQEVIQLKKALEDEVKSREVQLQEVRHKNTQQVEQVNVELDNAKKVGYLFVIFLHLCILCGIYAVKKAKTSLYVLQLQFCRRCTVKIFLQCFIAVGWASEKAYKKLLKHSPIVSLNKN